LLDGLRMMNKENKRLQEAQNGVPWKKWGPYLSERQWGTVREDHSSDGNAWDHFPHSHSGSRAYRWGEDGLAGISDDQQHLCFSVALWNGKDSVLKERLFGLTGPQGNHGEDVKEYYFYLDNTPTHSYMKYLYKYPQAAFPYDDLVSTNSRRSKHESEYELLDTGLFHEDRYFDLFVEYAKETPEDLLIKLEVFNRGPERATLRVLPTFWFRNTWSWMPGQTKPSISALQTGDDCSTLLARHPRLGDYHLLCEPCLGESPVPLLFVDNETNAQRLFGSTNSSDYVKDGINDYVISGKGILGQGATVNPHRIGTKASADYRLTLAAGESQVIRLRLCQSSPTKGGTPFDTFDAIVQKRREEADQFYAQLYDGILPEEEQRVMRQSLAGMLWSKQYYEYDVARWLQEQPGTATRNTDWHHMKNHDVISMPDKWEYPWYAVWDTAFHALALVMVDPDFAKHQLQLFLEDRYQHPNGQIPAYEWNFSDVNPPVHAWAVRAVYHIDREKHIDRGRHNGPGDIDFLQKTFTKLEKNFQWWGSRKGPEGNVYQGGFLGLDNIGVFDRSAELPTGGHLEQADGTAWMALYAQNMIQLSLELAKHDKSYQSKVIKYLDEFLSIATAMDKIGHQQHEMWDEEDGFFYDVLQFPDGTATRLKVRSLVGLLPLCAVTVLEASTLEQLPEVAAHYQSLVDRKEDHTQNIACPSQPGIQGRRLLAIMDETKLRRVLARLLDEDEFLSPYGIRSLSKFHANNPYHFHWAGQTHTVTYLPGESDNRMFGGNSNWRGPVWMPANILILRSLLYLYSYYGDDLKVACPTRSNEEFTLYQIAEELSRRLLRIFLPDENGKRPVFGVADKFQNDPHWRDHLLFYEYFHGEDGSGIGASHQTGWTGALATVLALFGSLQKEDLLESGMYGLMQSLSGRSGER